MIAMNQQVAPPSTPYSTPIEIAAAKRVMTAAEVEAVKNGWSCR
jgi:glc operon protein GlcG